jgi:hypothetical protein
MAIGTLTVGVAANSARAVTNLKSFRKEVRSVKADCSIASTSVKGMTSALTRVAGPLAAAGAAYLSVRTFQTIANDLDLVGEQSERLGVTAQKLLELRYAGQMTGVSTDLLDKSVGRLNLNIAKAATGTGAGKDALSELGVTIVDLNAQSPDQQFQTIADAMKGVASQSDKARIATALFGKEGRTLLPTLELGAAGLGKMAAEQRKLMGSVSDADIAQIAKFNDEADRLSAVLGGIGRELTINIAPIASDAINLLSEAINYVRTKEGDGGVVGKAFEYGKKGYERTPLGFITGETYQKGGMEWLSKNLSYFSDSGSAGQLDDTQKAAQVAREAKAAADWKRHSAPGLSDDEINSRVVGAGQASTAVSDLWKSATAGAETSIGKMMDGFSSSLNTVGATINSTVAGADAAKRRGLGLALQGLNPLTGLAPLGMSDARKNLQGGPTDRIGPVSDRINDLVDAGGSEGYMALRANQRTARLNPADKSAPKIEKATADTAKAVREMFDWFKKGPKPVEA